MQMPEVHTVREDSEYTHEDDEHELKGIEAVHPLCRLVRFLSHPIRTDVMNERPILCYVVIHTCI